MKPFALLLAAAFTCHAQFQATSTTEAGLKIVHLVNTADAMEVDIVPQIGNRAIAFRVHGKNILYVPDESLADLQAKPGLNGVPLLAPWANRLDSDSYWIDGQQHHLDFASHTFDHDNNGLPIHGLLTHSPFWDVISLNADPDSATVTSALSFAKHPELIAQWPFPEDYRMTYRLTHDGLEVKLEIINQSTSTIPVAIGFHPYYRIPDHPRSEWVAHLAARQEVVTDDRLIPTGETKPLSLPNPLPLRDRKLDNGFTDLTRDEHGRAHFTLSAGPEQIDILFGPHYPVAILWEPSAPSRAAEFFCIEPMTGVTNAINLAHAGKYSALQTIPPGGRWAESFWINPKGF